MIFQADTFKGTFVHGLSIYCGGSNLLTLSKEREYMDMSLGAPQCRNLYLGFKAALNLTFKENTFMKKKILLVLAAALMLNSCDDLLNRPRKTLRT